MNHTFNFFKTFSAFWTSIDNGIYDREMNDDSVAFVLKPARSDLVYCINSQLAEFQPIDDCKELLQLALLFLESETDGIPIV